VSVWLFLWLMVFLKIPIVGLFAIVKWAIGQTPEVREPSRTADRPRGARSGRSPAIRPRQLSADAAETRPSQGTGADVPPGRVRASVAIAAASSEARSEPGPRCAGARRAPLLR